MLLAMEENEVVFEFTLDPIWHDYGLPMAVMGMFVVFVVLGLMVTFISLLPRIMALSSSATVPPATPIDAALGDDEISEELMVVIAAAVAATLQTPHRIVQVRGLTPADQGWSLRGRTLHHQSHQVPRRDPK
ncbi:MAG: OadG family transporter subunit [Pirellulales bacterium]|nr:OadG family protein [Planctomycetales bacterium]